MFWVHRNMQGINKMNNLMQDEKFKSIVFYINNNKIQTILIASFLVFSILNYGFVMSTATVAFFTYKFWNKFWEIINEKLNAIDYQFDLFKRNNRADSESYS